MEASGVLSLDMSYTNDAALQQAVQQVQNEPSVYPHWQHLVTLMEAQEGGLSRNAHPDAIAATRKTYDEFLLRFPLFFGYWSKYAELEFNIGGTETAEMVYERSVASVLVSSELWTRFCMFKIDTCHEPDIIREVFERGAASIGLDWLSHSFWDKYMEWEERNEAPERVFAILGRVIHIPLQQSQRYYDRYRKLANTRTVDELGPEDVVQQFKNDVAREMAQTPMQDPVQAQYHAERELRKRFEALHYEIGQATYADMSKRWAFENEIQPPYYTVEPLAHSQIVNWQKYLDFEETNGDYQRTKFLYERCLTATASYDDFWLRYARWTYGQTQLNESVRIEEVRNVYQRASCNFVPTCRPEIRLQYGRFEEALGHQETAIHIYEAIQDAFPGHAESVVALANVHRRRKGDFDGAMAVLAHFASDETASPDMRGRLINEMSRMMWQIKGDVLGARKIYTHYSGNIARSRPFWVSWLRFEISQEGHNKDVIAKVKELYEKIRTYAQLGPDLMDNLTKQYQNFLVDRGESFEDIKDFMDVDQEIFGPFSVARGRQARLDPDGDIMNVQRRMVSENGHPGLAVDEHHIYQGGNPYTKYYAEQGEYAAETS